MPEEIVNFTKELVEIPSQNGIDSEKAIAEIIKSKLESFGFKPEIIGDEEHPSVICSISKGDGKTIWLESCTDTVPVGDESKWQHPPLEATIEGDKMFGRGVADCKIGIATFCYLAKELAESKEFQGNIFLGFDADEQLGQFTGIKDILKNPPKADVCILGYQGNDKISIGARGWLRLSITIHGEAAHTGSASKRGSNAVHHMAKALDNLLKLDFYSVEPFFEFGPSLNVTKIAGGDSINIVPDKCEAWLDIRWTPSQSKDEIIAQIDSVFAKSSKENGGFKYEVKELQGEPAYLSNPEDEFIKILQAHAEKNFGKRIPLEASGQGSVGNVISKLGIPIINAFGCSSGNVHAPNEWVDLSDLPKVFEVYKQTIIEFCSVK